MKKMYFLVILAGVLFAGTQQSMAQNEKLTSKTATSSKGYTVLNPGEAITIYKHVHGAYSPKEAEKNAPNYLFTSGSTNELQPLTKMNLKKAFPDNHPFHDAIDANFREDKELINYDDFHKMYKVNRLLMANPTK